MKKCNSSRRALLFSALTIVLCIAMLIGTTFAWFTDTASTGVNKIQSGRLDVDIQNEAGKSISNLEWFAKDGRAQSEIFWEPGCTYTLTPFKIVNTGNLALKYKLVVTGLDGDSELLDVIKFTYNVGEEMFDISKEGHLAPNGGSTGMITVSAHMDEAAGNKYQEKTLEGIGILVVATQDTVENDSFDNQYDKNATYPVTSQGELDSALDDAEEGANIVIPADIPVSIDSDTNIKKGVTIEGAGKDKTTISVDNSKIVNEDVTIKNATIVGSGSAGTRGTLNLNGNNTTIEDVDYKGDGNIAITVSTGAKNKGTVFRNTTITNAFRGIQFWSLSGDSLIDNCVIDVPGYTFNIDAVVAGATLTLKDSTLNGWTSYTSGIKLVSFENCKLGLNAYEYLRPYSETKITNCEFTSAGYMLNAGGSDAYTITIDNCTKNGQAITAANVKSLLLDTDDWNANVTLIVNGVNVQI